MSSAQVTTVNEQDSSCTYYNDDGSEDGLRGGQPFVGVSVWDVMRTMHLRQFNNVRITLVVTNVCERQRQKKVSKIA